MDKNAKKRAGRLKRHRRVRKRVVGTAQQPRLGVFRSSKHIYGMLVDDENGRVLVSISSRTPEIRKSHPKGSNREAATAVGAMLAERAKANSISTVVFDRSGYKFHGRVRALAESARKSGLKF